MNKKNNFLNWVNLIILVFSLVKLIRVMTKPDVD